MSLVIGFGFLGLICIMVMYSTFWEFPRLEICYMGLLKMIFDGFDFSNLWN